MEALLGEQSREQKRWEGSKIKMDPIPGAWKMKSPLQQMARGKRKWGAKPEGGKYNEDEQKARKNRENGERI